MKRISLFYFFIFIASTAQAQWSTAALSQWRLYPKAASYGSKVFFGGGQGNSAVWDLVDIYDINSNSWTTTHLSEGKTFHTATAAEGKVFFAGGRNNNGETSKVVDVYDIASGTWTTEELSVGRLYLASVALGTKVYFGGGFTISPDGPWAMPSNVLDIYDVITDTWTSMTLPHAMTELSMVAADTRIFFVASDMSTTTVDIYNTSTNQWTTTNYSVGRLEPAVAIAGSKLLIAGGSQPSSNYSSLVDIYDINTQSWTTATLSQ